MDKLKKILPISIIAFFVGTISFLSILSLSGYEIDVDNKTVKKTGIITIKSQPSKASITIDDRPLEEVTGVNVDIKEGVHEVDLFKEGYLAWSHLAIVEHAKVTSLDYPLLLPAGLSEDKILATTNVETSFYDQEDDVVYFVGLDRSSEDDYFYTISTYSLDAADYTIDAQRVELDLTEFELPNSDTVASILQARNGIVIISVESDNVDGKTVVFDSKQPDEVYEISDYIEESYSGIQILNDKRLLINTDQKDLVMIDDWATDESEVKVIAENVKTFSSVGSDSIVLQTNNAKSVQLIELDNDTLTNVSLPNVTGTFESITIHNHGGNDNILLVSPSGALSYNLNRITASSALIDPTWSTTLKDVVYSSSNDGRFISFNNGQKMFSYDYKNNKSKVFQLSQFINPESIRWVNDHYFVAVEENGDALLVSDYDGENQYVLRPERKVSELIGMNEFRTSIKFIDVNNSIWDYSLVKFVD